MNSPAIDLFLVKNSGKRHFQIAINLKGNKSNI
jgi:hypothetical protein